MSPSTARRLSIVGSFVVLLVSCGGDSEQEVSLVEWVDNFDRMCIETSERLSDETLTGAEIAAIDSEAFAELRAFPEPTEMATEARALIDALEQSRSSGLTDAEIEELDARILRGLERVGSSGCR